MQNLIPSSSCQKKHLQWKMNLLWRNLRTLSCKFPFPTLPHSPSASNKGPKFAPWSCLSSVHRQSGLPEKGVDSRGYSFEIYNRHNMKWKSTVCNIYSGSLQFVGCIVYRVRKKKSHADHWEFVSGTHEEQAVSWCTFGIAASPCNVPLHIHCLCVQNHLFLLS